MLDEAKKSLEKNLSDKLVSPFWGAFIASWCVWNWRALYITFFVDSGLLMQSNNALKVDYIYSFYPTGHYYGFFYSIIPPLLASYLLVFWFSKITRLYYVKALDDEFENKIIRLKKEEEFLKIEGRTLQAKEANLNAEEKVIKKETEVEKIKSEKSQEDAWNEEYEQFRKTRHFQEFSRIKESIYEQNGWTEWGDDYNKFKLSVDMKAYFDSNKIIEKSKENSQKIALTEKGKYFMKKYTAEN